MSSSSFNRSVEHVDSSSSTANATFTPLHRTAEIENLHSHVDQDKQLTNQTTTTTTKKVLTKCITVIGDGTDK